MMTMKEMHDDLLSRIATKEEQLATKQEHFRIMVDNEIQGGCFEQNAINSCLTMMQLKSEIEQLKFQEMLVRSQISAS